MSEVSAQNIIYSSRRGESTAAIVSCKERFQLTWQDSREARRRVTHTIIMISPSLVCRCRTIQRAGANTLLVQEMMIKRQLSLTISPLITDDKQGKCNQSYGGWYYKIHKLQISIAAFTVRSRIHYVQKETSVAFRFLRQRDGTTSCLLQRRKQALTVRKRESELLKQVQCVFWVTHLSGKESWRKCLRLHSL